jgi:hypothetical protein
VKDSLFGQLAYCLFMNNFPVRVVYHFRKTFTYTISLRSLPARYKIFHCNFLRCCVESGLPRSAGACSRQLTGRNLAEVGAAWAGISKRSSLEAMETDPFRRVSVPVARRRPQSGAQKTWSWRQDRPVELNFVRKMGGRRLEGHRAIARLVVSQIRDCIRLQS